MSDALKSLVLIVDDEPQIRRLSASRWRRNGYRVFDAATGSDGIAQAASAGPTRCCSTLACPISKAWKC